LSQQNPSKKEVGFVDHDVVVVEVIKLFGKAGW
jgi:hypothetical protein